jgi:hypothetical protein
LRKELDLCILSMCVCSSRIECHRSVLAQAHTIWMYAPTHHMYPYVSTGMSRMCIYVYSCNYTCSYSYAVYTYVYIYNMHIYIHSFIHWEKVGICTLWQCK